MNVFKRYWHETYTLLEHCVCEKKHLLAVLFRGMGTFTFYAKRVMTDKDARKERVNRFVSRFIGSSKVSFRELFLNSNVVVQVVQL